MKKRDLFWLNRILLIFFVGLTFVLVSIYNIVQFNNTYILEEKKELELLTKQIEWAIIPLLKQKDIQLLEIYANDFKNNQEFSFSVLDSNKNIIISSFNNREQKPLKNDKKKLKNALDVKNQIKNENKNEIIEENKKDNENDKIQLKNQTEMKNPIQNENKNEIDSKKKKKKKKIKIK